MNWLAILLAFQVGTSSDLCVISTNNDTTCWQSPDNAFYVDMEMGAQMFKVLTLQGFMKSYQISEESIFFAPYRIDYGFEAKIEYSGFCLGFKHECDHPIISNMSDALAVSLWGRSNTEIYGRYELKINP